MKPELKDILICDYEPKYAASLATMWNTSTEGWNGHFFNYDEEKVLDEQQNSSAVACYLAVKGDEVLGYVDIEPYLENNMNIGMLNVLPAYRGTGVGKLLVQRCVLKTAELGIPTLSLFTWAGNTKAVPLYKKCGFFWLNMQASATFLLNFLPGIMGSEVLRPYFEYFDWYSDFIRELKVEPDGEDKEGFSYYTYLWRKGDKSLRVVVERTSRAIVEIESADFHLSSRVQQAKPVFGDSFEIAYSYECYNSAYQDLEIIGKSEHNIDFQLKYRGQAKPKLELKAKYKILAIEGKYSEWDVMPAVCSQVSIANKAIILGYGQDVQYPIGLELTAQSLIRADHPQTLYLNLCSNLKQACKIRLAFPEDDRVRLSQRVYELELDALEKRVLLVEFSLSGSVYYIPDVKVEFTVENSAWHSFELEPELLLMAHRGTDAKRGKEQARIVAACHCLMLTIKDPKNMAFFTSAANDWVRIHATDFGRPFSGEFETKEVSDIQFSHTGDAVQMELFYESTRHAGLKFSKIFCLYPSGELQIQLCLQEIPEEAETLCLRELIATFPEGFTYAKGDELVRLDKDVDCDELSDFDAKQVSEPWLYFERNQRSVGIIWGEDWKLMFDSWQVAFELDLAKLKSLPDMLSPAITIYQNCFASAHGLRKYAMGGDLDTLPKRLSVDIEIAGHNPVCESAVELKIVHHQKIHLKGKLKLPEQGFSAEAKADKSYRIPLSPKALIIVKAQLSYPGFDLESKRLLIHPSGKISFTETADALSLDNGLIGLSARLANTLPLVSSFTFKGLEWLDPAPEGFASRATFNPYTGGMILTPAYVKLRHFMQDKHSLKQGSLQDQFGNIWQGLVWESEVSHFEPLKGLIYRQYYLTLPGVPVLLTAVEIVQDLGQAGYMSFGLQSFLEAQSILPYVSYDFLDESSKWHSCPPAEIRRDRSSVATISRLRMPKISLYTMSLHKRAISMSTTNEYHRTCDYTYSKLSPEAGDILPNLIRLFSEEEIDDRMAQDLLSLRLKRV